MTIQGVALVVSTVILVLAMARLAWERGFAAGVRQGQPRWQAHPLSQSRFLGVGGPSALAGSVVDRRTGLTLRTVAVPPGGVLPLGPNEDFVEAGPHG